MEYKSIQHKIYMERAGLLKNNEEVEQIDELSKKTLKSYGKKAYADATQATANAHDKVSKHIDKTGKPPSSEKQVMKIAGKEIMHVAKRTQGLARAETRLAKEESEQIDESLEELTPSKHGSFSVNSKISKTKEGFHKGQHVGMDTLVHKGTVQHKDNSKPSKFEVHNHVNRGLTFQTHHSDEEKQAIKQHLVKNKMADKHTDITD